MNRRVVRCLDGCSRSVSYYVWRDQPLMPGCSRDRWIRFLRAQQLVSDGNGAAGRALDRFGHRCDTTYSLCIRKRFSGEPVLPRALRTPKAITSYSGRLSTRPRAADALLRLAQLELARGDRDGALLTCNEFRATTRAANHWHVPATGLHACSSRKTTFRTPVRLTPTRRLRLTATKSS
jgi:hypothetical protein